MVTLQYQKVISSELERRCFKNPRYSIRAFAKALAMDSSSLSQIMSGKRKISQRLGGRLCERLALPPKEAKAFLASIRETTRETKREPHMYDHSESYQDISLDLFQMISDWKHYAMLQIVALKDFQSQPRWMAKRLGISVTEARLVIDRLKRLGLLAVKKGKLVRTTKCTTTVNYKFTAPALRKLQKDFLEKAMDALENDPYEMRDVTAITMAVNPKHFEAAREEIKRFRRRLRNFMQTGPKKEVYQLNIQLFPLTRR